MSKYMQRRMMPWVAATKAAWMAIGVAVFMVGVSWAGFGVVRLGTSESRARDKVSREAAEAMEEVRQSGQWSEEQISEAAAKIVAKDVEDGARANRTAALANVIFGLLVTVASLLSLPVIAMCEGFQVAGRAARDTERAVSELRVRARPVARQAQAV